LSYQPISTCPDDLRERVEDVFNLIKIGVKASNSKLAEAFGDVISYSSYAGQVPIESQSKLINWIMTTYDENDVKYVDAVASVLCMCNSKIALDGLVNLLKLTNNSNSITLLNQAVLEVDVAT